MGELEDKENKPEDTILAGLVEDEPKDTAKPVVVKEEKPKKPRKATKVEKPAKTEKEVLATEPLMDKLDPREAFLEILGQMGLKRGVEIITDVFFTGNIDDPAWLDSTLILANVNKKQREMLITRYYGASPHDLGVILGDNSNATKKIQDDTIDSNDFDASKMLKEQYKTAQNMQMIKHLQQMNAPETPAPVNEVIEEVPLFDSTGKPIIDPTTEKQAYKRIVSRGVEVNKQDNSFQSAMAMMQLMKDDAKPDSNSNMHEMMTVFSAKFDTLRHEQSLDSAKQDLQRERDKFEEASKRHVDDLRRAEDKYNSDLTRVQETNAREVDAVAKSMGDKLESLQTGYARDIQHREDMDNIQGMFGNKIKTLEDDLSAKAGNIKDTVVKELLKQGSVVTNQATTTVGAFVDPMAKIMQQMYATSLNQMNPDAQQQGQIPNTTNSELQELITDT